MGVALWFVTAGAFGIAAAAFGDWLDRRARRRCLAGQVSRTEQRIAARKGEP